MFVTLLQTATEPNHDGVITRGEGLFVLIVILLGVLVWYVVTSTRP